MKTRSSGLLSKFFYLFAFTAAVCFSHLSKARAQHLIQGQDSSFLLYSKIDSTQLKKHQAVFNFEQFDVKAVYQLRKTLQPYLTDKDPLAEFLYGASMDLYPYGQGKPKEAVIALDFYTKAADKRLAQAEELLFDIYRYGLMDTKRDEQKAMLYLTRFIQHGDAARKAKGYLAMATLFESGEFTSIQPHKDSTLYYLEKALTYTPNDGWALDYAGGLYEENGNYEKAILYLLRSDNDQSHIKVAQWLIEGVHIHKDVNRALQIMYKIADNVMKVYGKDNLNSYMGGSNPVFVLNEWYYCKKLITREQVGKYLRAASVCD